MLRERELGADELVDVVAARAPHCDPFGRDRRRLQRLADRERVLVAEPEPEPCVDELRIGGGHDRVVRGPSVVDPPGRRRCVEVADELRLGDRVPGRLDPHVRPPRLVERHADEVAGEHAVAQRRDSRRVLAANQLHDLGAGSGGVLVARVEARLDAPVLPVARGEEGAGRVEVLFGERHERGGTGDGGRGHRCIVGGAAAV